MESTSTVRLPNDWQVVVERPDDSVMVWDPQPGQDPMRRVERAGRMRVDAIAPTGERYRLERSDLDTLLNDEDAWERLPAIAAERHRIA